MIRLAIAAVCLLACASIGAVAQVQSGVQPLRSGVVPLQSGVAGATQQRPEAPRAPTMYQAPERESTGEHPRPTSSAPAAFTTQAR